MVIRDDLHNSSYFNYYSNSVANNIPLKGSVCFYKDDGVDAQRKEKEEEVVYRFYLFYYTKSITLNRWRPMPMKTVIKKVVEKNDHPSSYIKRVSEDEAITLVKTSEWNYASKELWKEKVRDVNKKDKEEKPKKKKGKKGKE